MKIPRHRFISFLIACLVLPFTTNAFPPNENIHFRQLSSADGLSRGTVNDIIQDHRGFIWIATEKGLHFYDGQTFRIYRHTPGAASSLSHSEITTLHEDSEHALWIGTPNGLNVRTDSHDSFLTFRQSIDDRQAAYVHHITALASDSSNGLWIGTAGAGLFRFDKDQKSFQEIPLPGEALKDEAWLHILCLEKSQDGLIWIGTKDDGLFSLHPSNQAIKHYPASSATPNTLPHPTVRAILEAEDGSIWVGTEAGIGRLKRSNDHFQHYTHNPGQQGSLPSPYIDSILQDREQNIWVGTDGGGLCVWREESQSFQTYHSRAYDTSSITSDSIREIMEDSAGDLWIAHFPAGISHANRLDAGFHIKKHIPGNPLSLSHNSVKGFAEDSKGNVWVSTDGGGLNYWNRAQGTFNTYRHDPSDPSSISAQEVLGISIDSEDTLWAGTWRGGLNRLENGATKFTVYSANDSEQGLSDPNLFTVLVDRSDIVWAGSLFGLNRFDRATESFKQYLPNPNDPASLSNHEIWTLYEGQDDSIWIGTRMGVCRYNRKTDDFTRYPPHSDRPDGLQNAWISSIHQDSEGRMWLGTHGGGLHRFEPRKNRYEATTEIQGLADNYVCGILEDDAGNLWISTYNGISKYDPNTKRIRNFGSANGLPRAQFNRFSAHLKLSDNSLLFGSTEGLIWFDPKAFHQQQKAQKVYLTGLSILNQAVSQESHPKLIKNSLWNTRELKLKPGQSLVRFEFSTPIYRSTDEVSLQFKLEGFDEQWRESDQEFATEYHKLPPGNYTLRAVSVNADGVRSPEETTLQIEVLPSLTQSNWFRGIGLLSIAGLFAAFHRSRINTIKRHSRAIEESNERLQAEIAAREETEEDLESARQLAVVSNQAKGLFLANMSHEIRTPLNGIIGITDIMLEEDVTPEHREMLEMIQSSGSTLLTLVNDILDFSKIESGEFELEETRIDIRTIIEDSIDVCSLAIGEKPLELVYYVDPDVPEEVITDPTRLRQIISNLISNGVKFTEKGEVRIEVESEHDGDHGYKLKFTIQDTGIGIPEEGLKRLFRSFSQVDASTTRKYGGSGLGLTISKRLVELLGGTIGVESEEGAGSRFHFSILCKEVPTANEAPSTQALPYERLSGKNLLIVDSNETRIKMIQAFVEPLGMNTYPVQSSRDASSLQRKFCSAFDLIVLDAAFSIEDDSLLSIFTNRTGSKNDLLVIQTRGQSMGFQNDEHSAMARLPKPIRRNKLLKTLNDLLLD